MKSIPRGSNKAYVQLSFFDLPTKKHRICQICSVVFIPSSNSSGLYCSPRCGCAGRWINSHHCAYTHICKQCGKEFTKAYEASYCSPHCGAIGRRKEATGNCLYCDKEITFKLHSKRIYCSPQCRNRHLNKTLPRKTRSIWTPDQLAYLREHYLADGSNEVAIAVGKTHNQVVDKANKMKISNSRIGAISRLHRDRPSGYELSVRQALDSLNIAHDASVVIKDKFIVDIKIGNLIIEADGDYWHGHARFEPLTERQLSQQKRDIARNKYLLACGYGVERIWESDFSLDYLKAILHKHHII